MDQVRKVFEVNLFARFVVTKAFTPLLMQAKGTILNIGSIAGMNPSPWKATDNACAAAMINWNDTLRIELEPFDVQVILVSTGLFSISAASHSKLCHIRVERTDCLTSTHRSSLAPYRPISSRTFPLPASNLNRFTVLQEMLLRQLWTPAPFRKTLSMLRATQSRS